MPMHLDDLDVVSEAAGLSSALIVPCNMCPAVTVAVNQNRPFMQLFRSLLTSPPFERHIKALQTRLRENGVETDVFKSRFYHQWFMCMWTSGRRKKLQKEAREYDAVIVLGCDTATETVRDAVRSDDSKVIEGMVFSGLTNARLSVGWPANISFEDCKVVPLSQRRKSEEVSA